MSWKLGCLSIFEQHLPLWWSDGLQSAHALLFCSAAFVFYTMSRLLAAHAADAVLEEVLRLASSPVEVTAVVVLALCLLGYSAGCSRLVQLVSACQLKAPLLGAVLAVSTSRSRSAGSPAAPVATQPWPDKAAQPHAAATAKAGQARSSPAGAGGASPRKEIASHRLAERRGGRSSLHKHRWSFDVAPSSGPRKEFAMPKQRGSPSKPASPLVDRHEPQQLASPTILAARRRSDGGASASSLAVAPCATGLRRREPPMQRIASGQQLAELTVPRRSLENTLPPPTAAGFPPPALPAQALPADTPSNILRANRPPSSGQQQAPAAAAAAAALEATPGRPAVVYEEQACEAGTGSPTKTTAAMTAWVCIRTLVPISSWATSTVDSYLRPLLPGASPAPAALVRAQSAPAPSLPPPPAGAAAAQREASAAERGAQLVVNLRRRASVDGGGVCSYTRGAVSADLARKERLEQLACVARVQGSGALSQRVPVTAEPNISTPSADMADLGACAGRSALASVGLDGDCAQEIRELVTDEHLVQFGAVLGEAAALKASSVLGLPEPWGSELSLFGSFEGKASDADEWEQIVGDSKPGLQYNAWRRPLRRGLYVYRSSTVVAGVTPRELRAFHLDDDVRALWDDSFMDIVRVQPAGPAAAHPSPRSESCLHRLTCRFPRPMAARAYSYARRVWHRPTDGGCYIICRSADLPPAEGGARAVQVADYVSCAVVRAVEGGVELATVYFDDCQVRPSLAKMAVPKALFPFILKYEAALRACLDRPEGGSGRRGSLDGSAQAGMTDVSNSARGGRQLGGTRWRRGSMDARAPNGSKKLLRNVVLATGIKLMYDALVRR